MSRYKRAQACRYGWQLLISVHTVINIYWCPAVGSCLQAGLVQAGLNIILPAHYISNGSYHALLPSRKCPPKWQCVQILRITVTPYNSAACIIPKRLYKLIIWYGEINTMIVPSLSLLRDYYASARLSIYRPVSFALIKYTLFNIWILIHWFIRVYCSIFRIAFSPPSLPPCYPDKF